MARQSDMNVKYSFASTIDKPIAEPLASPTCILSCISFIVCFFWLFIQVGFQLRYIYLFWLIVFFHYVKSGVKKSLKVSFVPLCIGRSKFIPL
jgi:amino acid transporter